VLSSERSLVEAVTKKDAARGVASSGGQFWAFLCALMAPSQRAPQHGKSAFSSDFRRITANTKEKRR
jgi:hypothetical protein